MMQNKFEATVALQEVEDRHNAIVNIERSVIVRSL